MITNYATLKADVATYIKRTDLTDRMGDFIQLAEADINRSLTLRQTEAKETGVATSAVINFPAGMSVSRVSVQFAGSDYSLKYSPHQTIVGTGRPEYFTVETNQIRLMPAPDSSYTYTVFYTPNLKPLSDANPTNWVLLNAPDVYLYGTAVRAALDTQDAEAVARDLPVYKSALIDLQAADDRRVYPRQTPLQIKPRRH